MAVIVEDLPHVAFTMLRNCWLRDRRISYKAKGLLGYLRSHATGYRCSQAQMVRESDDGRAAVRAALDELEAAGYLERVAARSETGQYAETDYRMRDPFDLGGQLLPRRQAPKTSAPTAGEQLEIDRVRKSDMATVSDFPTRIIAPIEDNGGEHQETPPESPAGPLRVDGKPRTIGQRANALAQEHYDATGGLAKFQAVAAIVRRALSVEGVGGPRWTDDDVRKALTALRETGRPVTLETIRPELDGTSTVRPSGYRRPAPPYRDPVGDPNAFRGGF